MRTEIGSEFWTGCTPLDGQGITDILPQGFESRMTLCGRTALELILRDLMAERQVRKAYLPSYCCHTMIEPFLTKGIEVEFYDVYFAENGIALDFHAENDCDVVFLMDYFGFLDPQTERLAREQRQRNKIVLYDATHALFAHTRDYSPYHYVFASFRKWFGVNGGFCAKAETWTCAFPHLENSSYSELRSRCFHLKASYMAHDNDDKAVFLEGFSRAEDQLETDYLGYSPDSESVEVLQQINPEGIRIKRRANAQHVIAQINSWQDQRVFSPYRGMTPQECPLFVPLYVDPALRADLRTWLIQNEIYLPVHWPVSGVHCLHARTRRIYDSELSFVCDQRYGADHMNRAVSAIKVFLETGR